jgi:hypothetical protein
MLEETLGVPMIEQGVPLRVDPKPEKEAGVLADLLDRWRPNPVKRRIEASIRAGTGLSKRDWVMEDGPIEAADIESLTDEIRAWCRERMAAARRPYGIDQLALALACAVPGGDPLASTTFGVFRPAEFYADDGVSDRLGHFLKSVRLEELNRRLESGASGIRFAAALFSWGDVAREAIFRDEDAR